MSTASLTKKKQYIIAALVATAVFVLIKIFTLCVAEKPSGQQVATKNFNFSGKDVDLREYWVQELENESKKVHTSLISTQEDLAKQKAELEKQHSINQQLAAEIAALKEAQSAQHNMLNFPGDELLQQADFPTFTAPKNSAVTEPINFAENPVYPSVTHIKISNKQNTEEIYMADTYIPAGSFVKATVLGGMLAGAGVDSQSDERAMLLKITDTSQLPNKVRRNIKNCHITAAGSGDISAKRAYIRTESMSCILNDERVFEKKIHAYLAGSDSMAGIQGQVIRNEKDMVSNAFWAGILRGGAQALSSSYGSTSTSALGSVTTMNKKDILPSMLSAGVGDSTNTLQDYFIQLAKQHHPVIEVTPGQEVTVVFLNGVSLKGVVK